MSVLRLMIGADMTAWLSHAYASVNLFLAAGPKSCHGEFEYMLFTHTVAQAVSVLLSLSALLH